MLNFKDVHSFFTLMWFKGLSKEPVCAFFLGNYYQKYQGNFHHKIINFCSLSSKNSLSLPGAQGHRQEEVGEEGE